MKANRQVAKLYLSNNPWRCECIFAMRFQELLRKYNSIIADSANVTCQYTKDDDDDDENIRSAVLTLTHGDICESPQNHMHLLDLLNGILGTLIVLILSKLAYDYYHYRKSGRLPWIVTKMS